MSDVRSRIMGFFRGDSVGGAVEAGGVGDVVSGLWGAGGVAMDG